MVFKLASAKARSHAALPLIPEPESALWSSDPSEVWTPEDPWKEVNLGVNRDLPRAQYSVSINRNGASITAGSTAALSDGRNMFAQIVHLSRVRSILSAAAVVSTEKRTEHPWRIPVVTISDSPRYAWRGLFLDPARHFIPLDALRRVIDALAIYRFNVLQLNLSDDQGWRFELQGYPKLTDIGSKRERTVEGVPSFDGSDTYARDEHGGFYTQDELRELVTYAKERGITIVPALNLPGHCQAAIASYPELGNFPDREIHVRETWNASSCILGAHEPAFQFVRDLLEQVAEVFDGPFVHIGGAEVDLTEWEESPYAQEHMRKWGYTHTGEIMQRFLTFATDTLHDLGKRPILWDGDNLIRVPDDALIMDDGNADSLFNALDKGFQSVAAFHETLRLDRVQGRGEPAGAQPPLTLDSLLKERIVPKQLPEGSESLFLGISAIVKGEYVPTATHLEYMLFPRLIAISQQAWAAKKLSPKELKERIKAHEPLLDLLGVESRKVDPR